ncbi:MAG: hypothetical protein GXP42_15925 [Chloroflexi bacterium]|nr:hypothetical protein [Chloroflexota bacterium]
MSYDVIIAGASFAGLAVAAPWRGKRVLLLSPKPIGAGQTSACGALVSTLESLGLKASIRQIHRRPALHTSKRALPFRRHLTGFPSAAPLLPGLAGPATTGEEE